MKQYLYSIVVISVVSALFRVLCPEGGTVRKYFSFLTSAALLCATVVPISGLIGGFASGADLLVAEQVTAENYRAVWIESISASTKEECEAAVAAHLCEEFDLSEKNVAVSCRISATDDGLRLDSIEITLYSGALLKNPRQMESYANETFGVPCTVSDGSLNRSE